MNYEILTTRVEQTRCKIKIYKNHGTLFLLNLLDFTHNIKDRRSSKFYVTKLSKIVNVNRM